MDEIGLTLHPLLHLNMEELWEEIEEEDTAHELKGSKSLSRYHSCPQLFEENKILSQSFESTTDDTADLMAFNRRKFSLHTGRIQTYEPDSPSSSTPTPPSSPRSARNSSVQESCQTPVEGQSNVSSPVHGAGYTNDHEHDFFSDENFEDDESVSSRSLTGSGAKRSFEMLKLVSDSVDISNDVLGKDGKHFIKRDKKYSRVKFNGTAEDKQQRPGVAGGTADKCSKWLQTVKMSQTEKIKSRSHVQLPPS